MCDSNDLSGRQSKKFKSKKTYKSLKSEALDRQTVNKKLCLRSNSHKRQSFSERICDDLCEEILQYLSLEDKLKLEGVSKQFQRTVLKKNYELIIDTKIRKNKNNDKFLIIGNTFYDLKSFELLLKKCPNITTIELRVFDKYYLNEVFRLITKYCDNLREIKSIRAINIKNHKEFQRKFGQKIKTFDRLHQPIDYNLFPNIEKIVSDLKSSRSKRILPQLKLKQLNNLTMYIGEGDIVKTYVDTFPTLKYFELKNWCENSDSVYRSLDYISNLKNLIYFGFRSVYRENTKLFCDSLKRMAKKCQKLKSIECQFGISSDNSDIRQIFSSFVAFPALKRLDLCLEFNYLPDFDLNEFNSFEAFKGLSNITHLTLHLMGYWNLFLNIWHILTDVDIYLPKLQYLEIYSLRTNSFKITPEEVTQMADILSRLSRLQTLKLLFFKGVDFSEIEVKIREKCRKIRTIYIQNSSYY